MHTTAQIQESLKAEQAIDLSDLNADVHHIMSETVEDVCEKPMEMLGYSTTLEIKATGLYIKPYNEFWDTP